MTDYTRAHVLKEIADDIDSQNRPSDPVIVDFNPEVKNEGKFNIHSNTWVFIKHRLCKEISELRAKNDGNLGAVETATIRGKIKMCKRLLSIEDEKL